MNMAAQSMLLQRLEYKEDNMPALREHRSIISKHSTLVQTSEKTYKRCELHTSTILTQSLIYITQEAQPKNSSRCVHQCLQSSSAPSPCPASLMVCLLHHLCFATRILWPTVMPVVFGPLTGQLTHDHLATATATNELMSPLSLSWTQETQRARRMRTAAVSKLDLQMEPLMHGLLAMDIGRRISGLIQDVPGTKIGSTRVLSPVWTEHNLTCGEILKITPSWTKWQGIPYFRYELLTRLRARIKEY